MTTRDFCYWLRGIYEIDNDKSVDLDAIQQYQRRVIIKKQLSLVIQEIDKPDF